MSVLINSEMLTALFLDQQKLDNQTPGIYCTRCEQKLDPERVVWLELSVTDGTYSRYVLSDEHASQGCFPFGIDCAKRESAKRKVTIK